MNFPSEEALVEHALPLISERFQHGSQPLHVQREVGVGRNIADVVLMRPPHTAPHPELAALTTGECVVLAALRKSGATRIDLLEQRCGLSPRELRIGALNRLVEWGLVSHGRGGRVALESHHASEVHIVAVEAKLRRWRQALQQASQYSRYADLSFVLLPESAADVALEHVAEFESTGVGLLLASEESLSVALSGRPNLTHDWRREFVFSRLLCTREAPIG